LSRSLNDQAFKRSEMLRLIRIAKEGGISKYRIACPGGYTLVVDTAKDAAAEITNEWDEQTEAVNVAPTKVR
jgi:hypothetical protein